LLRELWNIEKGFRMSKSDLRAPPVCHRKRDSVRARLVIDRLAIAWYALRYGLNADEMAFRSPGSWTGSSRAADMAE
jgi:hypothetical protein